MNILAVDDSEFLLHALVREIEQQGHSVTGCLTYAEAIREAHRGSYDAMVTDYLLGALDGLKLRTITGLPTVLITGSGLTSKEQQEINQFRSEGWPVLRKPFMQADLAKAIQDAIQQERAIHAAN